MRLVFEARPGTILRQREDSEMNRSLIRQTTILFFCALAGNGNTEPVPMAKPHTVIGVSVLATNNPFFVEMGNAMQAEASKHGAEIILTSADSKVAIQKRQVADFIGKRVSAIVLCPADSKAIGSSIAE